MDISAPVEISYDILQLAPTSFGLNYVAMAVAPHVLTDRDTYTVPANRMAICNGSRLGLEVNGAALNGVATIAIRCTPSGGAVETIRSVSLSNKLAGTEVYVDCSDVIVLSAGDELHLATYNGGANDIDFEGSVHIIEVDQP